jgi:uncharacterized protein (TIGR02001 family)
LPEYARERQAVPREFYMLTTYTLASMPHRTSISGSRALASILWISCSLIIVRGATAADFGAGAAYVSDYDYRGVSQSANHPALQLEADYVTDPLHLEIWTSNVQFGTDQGAFAAGHQEVAYSADLTFNKDGWLRYNVGINYATYPGLDPGCNYAEVAASVTHGPWSSSLHYAWDYCEAHPRLGAYYEEINGVWPLGNIHVAAVTHVGVSWGQYWTYDNEGGYVDYAAGVTGTWHGVTLLAEGINTHGYQSIGHGSPFSGKGKLFVSVLVAFSSASE